MLSLGILREREKEREGEKEAYRQKLRGKNKTSHAGRIKKKVRVKTN